MPADYFVYLPVAKPEPPWGVQVVAAGVARVPPGSPYPPRPHPQGRHFAWTAGRRMDAFQIVLVTDGRGRFESEASERPIVIEKGQGFVLFPGIWHRYAPDPATGWYEHWLECAGSAVGRALADGRLSAARPVFSALVGEALEPHFLTLHHWVRHELARRAESLGTLALHMLALMREADDETGTRARFDDAIDEALRTITARCAQPLAPARLAASLGMGYSTFRAAFRARTGLSPSQYHLQVRLRRAGELLANTPRSIKEIAEELGFSSPSHLAQQFRAFTGVTPRVWRTNPGPR